MKPQKPNNQITPKEALSRVQAMCSRQERCKFDILKKLHSWQIPTEDQHHIIASLEEDRFLNESRYTMFYVRDKFKFNKWGRIKIAYHLKAKAIPESLIQEGLDQISQEEYEKTLLELLTQKRGSIKDENPWNQKAKLLRFAQGRGFEVHLCMNIMENFIEQ